jgi:signal transduction histidine kinase
MYTRPELMPEALEAADVLRTDNEPCGGGQRLEAAEALLAGEELLLEMVARGDSLPVTLQAVCKVVEKISAGSICSILLADSASERLWHGAAPSLPPSYIKAINGALIQEGLGPCARSAFCLEPVVVSDVAALPEGAAYRKLALAHGLQACWSSPILSTERKILGTFAIYWRHPATPSPVQKKLIEQMTHVAAVAIERKHAEEALRRSEAYLAEAQRLSRTGSFGWDVGSGEIFWSRETYRIAGLDLACKPTLELIYSRVHPQDRAPVRQVVETASREGADLDFEHRLQLPDGAVKYVHVVARATRTEANSLEYIGSIMDITAQERTKDALRASERLARGQFEALTRTLDVMSVESDPERLVEHTLRTVITQLGAHSSSIWLKDESKDLMVFEFALEDGKLKSKYDASEGWQAPSTPGLMHPAWHEVLRTAKPVILPDVRQGPDIPWREHLVARGVITVLLVPLLTAGNVVGLVGVRFTRQRTLRPEEVELAQALANQAMLAIQLIRLSARSREAAIVAERNRMARDIHDTLAQGFTGIIVQLEAAEDAMSQGLNKQSGEHLQRAGQAARESLKEARRSVQALRPQALEGRDLCDALETLFQKMTTDTPIRTRFALEGRPRPRPPGWDENLLRIGQEVLTNALRHAGATTLHGRMIFAPSEIRLELSDNGRGFDPARRYDGFGLVGMRERVEGMGGQLTIDSAPEHGTAISIVLPLRE